MKENESTSVSPVSDRRRHCKDKLLNHLKNLGPFLAPLLIKLSGGSSRAWFLALYLPTAWQWPGIVFMLLLGLGILGAMVPLYLTHKKV